MVLPRDDDDAGDWALEGGDVGGGFRGEDGEEEVGRRRRLSEASAATGRAAAAFGRIRGAAMDRDS